MRIPTRNRYFFASDLLLLPCAAYASFVLRLESWNIQPYLPGMLLFGGLALAITLLIFRRTGVYSRYWRYASVDELMLLAVSVAAATIITEALVLLADFGLPQRLLVPRSIPFIYMPLALIAVAGPRLAVRMLARYEQRKGRQKLTGTARASGVLIAGAGSAGAMMVRELQQNQQLGLKVVGFVDDDPLKQAVRIHGVPVLGLSSDIPELVQLHRISQVIIAMPSAPGKVIRRIVAICETAGVRTKIIPGIYELLDGKVSVNQLRDVQIEDLLRRKPVRTNITAVNELLHQKRVLITGAGGSIGSELCRQVLRAEPAELLIMGHGENSIFTIQNELLPHLPAGMRLESVIADVRFPERLRAVFAQYQPQIVFHAAAHKHVPLMELNPIEAITNNVLGTRNLLQASLAYGVEHFVMISTDKAVNPTSLMGASKRIAELLVHKAASQSQRPFLAVRFGNVLGSRGSVVLTFKQQIAAGGPITVTHPEMRRFFMTIPEAVQLTLQAATLGRGGEVFTLDMGEPVRIVDLARDMIELSGLEVDRDIDIVFTGTRPGEKLYEELFVPGENYERTIHEKIFIACNASSFVPAMLDEAIQTLELAAQRNEVPTILRTIQLLVPQIQRPDIEELARETSDTTVETPLRVRAVGG